MPPIKASNIKAAGHNPESNTLRIRFSNGTEYDYDNIDASQFGAFMAAKSQGRFFHQNIKSSSTSTKVGKDENDG